MYKRLKGIHMKKLFICSVILAALSITSCSDFLTTTPAGPVDENTLLTEEGIAQMVTGMYATLHNRDYFNATLSNYAYGDVMGGSANKGSNYADQPDFTNLEVYSITIDNPYLRTKWRSVYDGVFRANTVLNMAGKMKDQLTAKDGEVKDYYTELEAQARFFRAFWHFEGIKLFGAAIPYVGLEEFQTSVNPKVSNKDESGSFIYIWDKVADDFKFAYDNLPSTWGVDFGRANKWAAGAFLAKLKVYQSSPYTGIDNGTSSKWAEAKTILEDIMANGKDNKNNSFKLANTYETLYTAGQSDWTGESVFDIQMTISGTQENLSSINGGPHTGMGGKLGPGGWGFYQPSNELVNSHIVDADGLPLLNKDYQKKPALSVKISETNLNPKTDLTVHTDPRLDISVGRFHVPYWDYEVPTEVSGWIREVSNGGYYLNKKNQPKKADRGSLSVPTIASSTAKNFHLFRYADVLLLYAEVLIETGDNVGARQYVNQVRERAAKGYVGAVDPATMEPGTSTYVLDDKVNNTTKTNAAANYRIGLYEASQFDTKPKALEALRFERKLELAMEGHRWYDLARWGIVAAEINDYLDYERPFFGTKFASSQYNAKWVTMPIPVEEIVTMAGVLHQSANWVVD